MKRLSLAIIILGLAALACGAPSEGGIQTENTETADFDSSESQPAGGEDEPEQVASLTPLPLLEEISITPESPPDTPIPTAEPIATLETVSVEALDLTQLWSYCLTSIRTGEPLIEEGNEHKLDENGISYGYNKIVDENGNVLQPRAIPLMGGEQLILTEDYQDDENMREYARIYTIMAPIRDTVLYHFEETTRDKWLETTAILTMNNIKTEDAAEISGRSILSTEQVYDYIASRQAEGSPVVRYLEEAGLELKCLAFKDFDFTNPEGGNHCEEHNLEVGSGIEFP